MNDELKTYFEGMEERIDKGFDTVKVDAMAMETRIGETIRDVVELVDKRFDAVDKRFDAVDKHFEDVDKRFDAVDKRFDDIEEKLDPMVNQVSGHEKRVKFLEDRLPRLTAGTSKSI